MKRFRQLISFLLLFVLNIQVFGNTVVDPNAHQNTNVTHSQNGVEVININTPTDRGVSVNTFQEYNVDQNGQIINNATGVGRSHLGGLVNPNNNLAPGQEARTVIFQVNGSNRSNIEGYIEALSQNSINLFIANENGIYANGAGFINIDRAVLTTGRLNLRGDGSVDTISVRNGVITIGPAGFDASRTNYMAMISRTQELHGKIVASGELASITGTNDVSMNDIETQLVNAVTVSGAKPELAIDGSAFGAMYAGQIKIMATELGVGVKSDSVIYAENGGIEILANGDVIVNKLQGNNINVAAANYEQTGVAYTQGNMNISALTSKILGEGTQVIGNLNFTGSLDNRADMQTNGKLTIGSNLNNIANISSVGNMDIFGNIVNTTGNISTEGFLLSRGNVTNNSGKIVVEGSFIAQGDLQNDSGMIYSEKDINVQNILNNGVIQSLENLQARDITNNGKIVSLGNLTGGNVINTSTIQSVGAIKVLNVDNSGTLLSESNIETHNLINRDTFISNGVLTTLNLTNETGALLQSVNNISTNSLVNRGDIATNGSMLSNNGFENYGTIGAQGTLTAGGINISNTGTIESGSITLTGANISNTGSLVGIENIILNTGYLQNTNSLLTNGNIEVTGNVLNQGTMEAGNDLRTRSLDNQGNITVTNNTTVLGDFLNTGRLLSAETLDIRGTNFVNNNEVLATNLLIDVSSNIINTGELTGGNTASLKGLAVNNSGNITGHNVILTTANLINTSDILSTNNISLNHATINNTGNIRSNTLIDFNNTTLTNNGVLESHNIYLQTGNVNNIGSIRSNETLNLNSTTLTNSGILESHNILLNNSVVNNTNTIRSNALIEMNNTWLSNSGTLESHEINMINLSNYTNTGLIKGNNTTLQVGYDLNLTGLLHGENSLEITGHNITLTSGTTGVGYIEVTGHNITNDQTELAANGIILNASGTLTNNKMITGNIGNLSGHDIVNNDLIAFGESLTINATNNVINNEGKTIYSGINLQIKAGNTILNNKGNINAQGLIKLEGNKVTNNVGQINTTGDILITSSVFENIGAVTGLDNFELYWVDWLGNEYTDAHINATWEFTDDKGGINTKWGRYDHLMDYIAAATNISGIGSLLYPSYGAHIRDEVINDWYAGTVSSASSEYDLGYQPIEQRIKSNAQTEHAVLSAGGNITINSGTIINQDGKISGIGTVSLNATDVIKNQSTISEAISLIKGIEIIQVNTHSGGSKHSIGYGRHFIAGDTSYVTGQSSVIEGGVVSLTTGKLELSPIVEARGEIDNGAGVSVSVAGKTIGAGTSQGLTSAAGVTGVSASGIGSGNVVIARNTTPIQNVINSGTISPNVSSMGLNAMFAASNNPSSNYLMETRSQYIDISAFYGSDYFLSRINYDDSKDWSKAKRLGDAYYEHLLLTRTIQDTLGTRFINGKSDQELIKTMLDNSVSVSEDLNLSVGVKLTKEQVAALKEDIIWYAYEEVNGEQVLVPQVYLSQATLSTIEVDVRDKIGGQEGTFITADEIRNTGQKIGNKGTTQIIAGTIVNETKTNELAEIKGNKTIVVAIKGNVENIGGKISGIESVSVVAEKGDVINSASITTSKSSTTQKDKIISAGEITSEGKTYISGVNYTSKGGIVEGENVTIKAENNVNIESVELKGSDKYKNPSGTQTYDEVRNAGSEVIGSESVTIVAGNDVNVKGSFVASEGKVAIVAENNVNIENTKDTTESTKTFSSKGKFKSTSSESRDYVESASASTIVGGDIVIDAGNDVNIRLSNLVAIKSGEDDGNVYADMPNMDESKLKDGNQNTKNNSSPKPKKAPSGSGNIQISAKNDINITVEELKEEHYSKEKSSGFSTSFSSKGGGLTAGVSYSKNSKEVDSNKTNISVSSLSSEGSTILNAGNIIRTEAMQANIGEDFLVMGKNGIDMLDAKEVYSERISEKSSSIGVSVSVGTTVTQLASTIGNVSSNVKGYGLDNPSQSINTVFNSIQDLRDVANLGGNLYDGIASGARYLNGNNSNFDKDGKALTNAKQNALSNLVSASITASYNKSSYNSNSSGTTSIAGNINVGGNMALISDGDVRLVNQKITVGENLIVEANNFEVLAGKNTYENNSSSKSSGVSAGFDIVNKTPTAGLNASKGTTNGSGITYDNSQINVGNIFGLTTKGDATFKGVNVTADKFDFDIGGSMLVESLQDEHKSSSRNTGMNLNLSVNKKIGDTVSSLNGGINASKGNQDSKWVNNQTSLIATNGGNISVGETLTNKGAILGSLSSENKLSISAKEVIIEHIKDYDNGKEQGISVSGIGAKTPIGQTGIQYGSHDKQQDTNTTFVNTTVVENGKEINIADKGANTDLSKAQVITKDETFEKIDINLHTDLANKNVRDELFQDILKTGSLAPEIIQGIQEGLNNPGETILGQISSNLSENADNINAFVTDRDNKLQAALDKKKDENGKLVVDSETEKIIKNDLQKTLDSFDKGDYDIIFIDGDSNGPSMSINDKDGIMYVNINGAGFGDAEQMRKVGQHDGSHGTYLDRDIDENAAHKVGNATLTNANSALDPSLKDKYAEALEKYNKDKEDGLLRDKIALNDPNNDSKDERQQLLLERYKEYGGDSEIYNHFINGSILDFLSTGTAKERMNKQFKYDELMKYIKFDELTLSEETMFFDLYQKDNADKLEIKIVDGKKQIIIKDKKVSLDGLSELEKQKTLDIRDVIESPYTVYLQTPNSYKNKLGLVQHNTSNTSHDSVYIYYDKNFKYDYMYDFDNIVIGLDGKLDSRTTFKTKQSGFEDSANHELLDHPKKHFELKDGITTYNYINDSRKKELGDFVYFKENIKRGKDQNGNNVIIVIPIPKIEANTLWYENKTRDKNSPTTINENQRTGYDEDQVRKNAIIFHSESDFENYFR